MYKTFEDAEKAYYGYWYSKNPDKNKAIEIINSCETDEHFEYSLNYIDLYYKKFEDFVGYNELKRLINQTKEGQRTKL